MLIREAKHGDLPEILKLLKEMDGEDALGEDVALSIWTKIELYPYYKVFVAEEEGHILGTCSLIILENLGHHGAKLGIAESMIVRSDCRGSGIGKQLMKHVMKQAKEEKCYKLMLSSNKKRVHAHHFYEQLGFQQHGISFMVEVEKE